MTIQVSISVMDFAVAIVAQQGAWTSMASCYFAAGLVRLYNGGGKNGWFLPSFYGLKLTFAIDLFKCTLSAEFGGVFRKM
jgi:hypothetical protein